MMILHSHNMIHRDLKLENILIDKNYKPHITDFALSKINESDQSRSLSMQSCVTAHYMAPEVITGNNFDTKADVYSFGILMYEVVMGIRTYREKSEVGFVSTINLLMEVVKGRRPTFFTNVKIMIEKCWSNNPNDHPTFSEIYKNLSLIDDDSNDQNCEEEEEDNENLVNKCCFDEIDVSEISSYVDEIKEKKDEENESIEKENKLLKNEIEKLKKQLEKVENTFHTLSEQNEENTKIVNKKATVKDKSNIKKVKKEIISSFYSLGEQNKE